MEVTGDWRKVHIQQGKAHIISVEHPDGNRAVQRPWHRQVSNIKINPTKTG